MKLSLRSFLAAAALSGVVILAGAPAGKANDRDDSDRRVTYFNSRHNEGVEHYRPYSRDARYWGSERHEAFERQTHFRDQYQENHRDYRYRNSRDYDHR